MRNWRIKKIAKNGIVIGLMFFLLTGCSMQRKIGFTPIQTRQANETFQKIRTQNFNFEVVIDNSENAAELNPDETEKLLHDRLKNRLVASNLMPVADQDAQYDLSGKLIMKETQSYNGLVVPAFIVGLGLFPVGLFIMPAIPYNDYDHETTTSILLKDINSGEVLLQKAFSKKNSESISGYWGGDVREPDSNLNQMFLQPADDVMSDLSTEVAMRIKKNK